MIEGFTVIRNGVANGYPFVPAIEAALQLCDRVVVSEGYSSDGTLEVLTELGRRLSGSSGGGGRVRIRRDRWDVQGRAGEPFRNLLNTVRRDLTGDYLFYFDADEILPVEDVSTLASVPETYPDRELFALPYRQFLGRYWFNEEFRFRFFRNNPGIRALWDGWTFGYHFGPAQLMKSRVRRKVMGRVLLALVQDRVAIDLPEQYLYLPTPIFHYYGLNPEGFVRKMGQKVWLQANPDYRRISDKMAEMLHASYDDFWKWTYDFQRGLRAEGARFNKEFPFCRYVPTEMHPPSIRPFFSGPAGSGSVVPTPKGR